MRCRIGLENRQVFPPSLPLTTLFDSAIQMISMILVHQILVDPKARVVGCLEAEFGVVYHVRQLGGVSGLNVGAWKKIFPKTKFVYQRRVWQGWWGDALYPNITNQVT